MQEFNELINALGGAGEVTAGFMIALIVYMIITGKLIPASIFSHLKDERDGWKRAYMQILESSQIKDSTIETLMETGRNMDHVIRSLPAPDAPHTEVPTKNEEPK